MVGNSGRKRCVALRLLIADDDAVSRTVARPLELPVGVITALVGVQQRSWSLDLELRGDVPTSDPTAGSGYSGSLLFAALVLVTLGVLVGLFALIIPGIFLAILVVGFIYEWKKGALEWD
mgnify:CR=1 FL=1